MIGPLLLACTAATPDDSGTADRSEFPLVLGGVVACEEPAETVRYQDVGEAWGLRGGSNPDGIHGEGGSVAVWDVEGDGDLDVVLGFNDDWPRLYRRNGDGFDEETLHEAGFGPWMAATADVDGDGDLDLTLGGNPPQLLLNDGGDLVPGELPAMPVHLDDRSAVVKELAPGDIDGDGLPELYALVNTGNVEGGAEERRDFLLRNDGTGTFTLDEESLPLELAGRAGFDVAWFDWDDDGDQDAYVVQDMGPLFGGNVLWENREGRLEDASEDCTCGVSLSGMGLDVGDYNLDGHPDLFIAATGGNALLSGKSDGTYVDVTATTGVKVFTEVWQMAWGAIFVDHDNDGWQDVLVAAGDMWLGDGNPQLPETDMPANLLVGDGEAFTDMAPDLELDVLGSYRSAVAADHNGDGVLDLLLTQVVDAPRLWLSEGCTEAGWLAVEAPPGSRVTLEVGDRVYSELVTTCSAYGAAGPPEVHFGLGDAAQVDRLEVRLPDGRIGWLESVAPRQRVVVSGE